MPISTINQNGLNAPLTLTAPNLGTPSAINLANATALPKAALPAGSVLQVVQTPKTDTWTSTSSTWVNITGFTATITPTSASSRILVMASVAIGINPIYFTFIRLARNGSAILVGDAAGSRVQTQGMVYMYNQINPSNAQITWSGSVVDSPALTSALTYSVQMQGYQGSTVYVNRLNRDDNADYEPRSASSLILMEIA